jgi:hypothetical protein
MEQINETFRAGLVHRAVAFGMALTTTAVIATSTAVIFTASAQNAGSALHAAVGPLRAVLGG